MRAVRFMICLWAVWFASLPMGARREASGTCWWAVSPRVLWTDVLSRSWWCGETHVGCVASVDVNWANKLVAEGARTGTAASLTSPDVRRKYPAIFVTRELDEQWPAFSSFDDRLK